MKNLSGKLSYLILSHGRPDLPPLGCFALNRLSKTSFRHAVAVLAPIDPDLVADVLLLSKHPCPRSRHDSSGRRQNITRSGFMYRKLSLQVLLTMVCAFHPISSSVQTEIATPQIAGVINRVRQCLQRRTTAQSA
jgi:hypothetical protein